MRLPNYHTDTRKNDEAMHKEVIKNQMEFYDDTPTRPENIRFLTLSHYPFEWIPGRVEALSDTDMK